MFNDNSYDVFIKDSHNCPFCGKQIEYIAIKQVPNSMITYQSTTNNRVKVHIKGKKVIVVVDCDKCLSEFEVYYSRDGKYEGEEPIDQDLKLY